MSDDKIIEEYKQHFISSNRVPEAQFSSNGGFGWTFGISPSDPHKPHIILVIKHIGRAFDISDINLVFELGRQKAYSLIDEGVQHGYFCYWWNHSEGIQKDDCEHVSPNEQRTPLWS